jgi:hypothetical protein
VGEAEQIKKGKRRRGERAKKKEEETRFEEQGKRYKGGKR